MRFSYWARAPMSFLLALALPHGAHAHAQASREFVRELEATAPVSWQAPSTARDPVHIRLLGLNDLHGQLLPRAAEIGGRTRLVGGAAALAAYIGAGRADPAHTLLLIAGDSIGASPAESGLLRDEPTMAVLNELAGHDCPRLTPAWRAAASPVVTRCHTLATLGNHEFDRGVSELERLLYGGRHPTGLVLGHDWQGTRIPYLAANVLERQGGAPLLPAAAIVTLEGVRIGVIGAVTAQTPGIVVANRVADLNFTSEAPAINAQVETLRARGVKTVVLVIHEGLVAPVTPQTVAPRALDELEGRLTEVLRGLDGGIDVVIAGHTHKLNNVLVPLRDGTVALVTQAISAGAALSVTDLTIDRATGAVVAKSARIAMAWADAGPGLEPVRAVTRIVTAAARETAAIVARPIGVAGPGLTRAETPSGESPLGNVIADAQRAAAGADFAFVNAGGVRSDVPAGPINFGTLYAVEPFGNLVMRVTLTGAQVLRLLEEQWSGAHAAVPRYLRPSGLHYVFDLRRAPGAGVVAAWDAANRPLDTAHRYTVAINDFLLGGGDFYPVLGEATDAKEVMTDIAALEAWVRRAPGPVQGVLDGRMQRLDSPAP